MVLSSTVTVSPKLVWMYSKSGDDINRSCYTWFSCKGRLLELSVRPFLDLATIPERRSTYKLKFLSSDFTPATAPRPIRKMETLKTGLQYDNNIGTKHKISMSDDRRNLQKQPFANGRNSASYRTSTFWDDPLFWRLGISRMLY